MKLLTFERYKTKKRQQVQNIQGYIYLLHFHQPYKHAKHYCGWTENLDRRLKEHATGNGARLMSVITAEGITWELARVWIGDRHKEREFKRNGTSQRCPICWLERRVIPMYEKDWRHRAACRDIKDPSIFFPIDTLWSQPGNESNAQTAKAVCRECPVSAECLEWAIESGESWALAGGMTPGERSALVRQVA